MSAKGRGDEVIADENYPTPSWATRRILEALPFLTCKRAVWLEPCVGDGAIVKVVQDMVSDCIIDAGDIRQTPTPDGWEGHWICQPFSGWLSAHCADAVITNPPFSLAPALIDHFLPRCDWLILLLRASFRLAPWRDNMPDGYKLPQRPEFVASEKCKGHNSRDKGCSWAQKVALVVDPTRVCPACGGKVQRSTSDSSEYSWFVWTPERGRSVGSTRILPDTPLAERKVRL